MKIHFRGVGAEELSFKMNRVKLEPNSRLDIKPQFSRQVRKTVGNEKMFFVSLEVKIESSEESPKPFDLNVKLTGVFETEAETLHAGFRIRMREVLVEIESQQVLHTEAHGHAVLLILRLKGYPFAHFDVRHVSQAFDQFV